MGELYNEIEKIIDDIIGYKGSSYELGAFKGFGWRHKGASVSAEPSDQIVVIKEQKNNAVHVYYAFWKFDDAEKQRFISVFGKSAVGKSCIRIKKLTEDRRETLAYIIRKSM